MRIDQDEITSTFRKDFLWYFVGSMIPMMISFIKTPIFTRYFSKDSYGQLGLVTISFAFFGMLLFSWISSCLWRYYSKYKIENRLTGLYTNLLVLFFISLFMLTIVCLSWYGLAQEDLIQKLILFCFFQLIFNQLFMGYMVVIRLMGRSSYYTVVHSIKSVISLILALILVFHLNWDISALVASLAIMDLCFFMYLILVNRAGIKLHYDRIDKTILIEMIRYGSAGLLLNLSVLSLSYFDRYIIAWFYGLEEVGIYDQVSKISQLSVMALVTIFFNTINPFLFKRLEHDFNGSLKSMKPFVFAFVFMGLPVVFYLSMFSEELATLLLGRNFREGYIMMPYFFIGSFLYGLSNFFELRLKFSNKIRRLGLIALSTAVFNILLNIILVSLFGYQWAAYSTLISYFLMFIILFYKDQKVLRILFDKRAIMSRVIIFLAVQYVLYEVFVDKFSWQFESRIVLGIIFAISFVLVFRKTFYRLELHIN